MSYDDNGNLLGDGLNSYTWNSRDQLTAIAGPVAAGFQYDAVGRRKQKTVAGTTSTYLYDGLNVVQEQGSGGSVMADHLTSLGIDEVFTRTEGGTTKTLLRDALGSTLALADGTGIVTSWTYDPYGKGTYTGVAQSNPFLYTGRELDGTGLYYYRARYYHPTLHRFIAEDPIGFAGGANIYGYVGGNPVSRIDLLGLDWIYSISTGQISNVDSAGNTSSAGTGYSGTGIGRDNPDQQGASNMGPIPEGTYDIGPGHRSPNTGPNTMNLTPQPGTDTYGRDLFRIHGDNAQNDASHGCIIANPSIRNAINNSSDKVLQVVR